MTIIIASYIFIVGLILGSFFNVVGLRVPQKLSIVRPPSSCSHCGTGLKSKDLIPVISWIWAKGKCSYCGSKLSIVYPLGELTTALLFLWMYIKFGNSWETFLGILLISLAVIITVSDLTYMLIPNSILLTMTVPVVVILVVFDWSHIGSHLLGALVGGGILLFIALITRGAMGMGDVKLFALLGLMIAFPNVVLALIIACLLGTMIGGILLAMKVMTRKQPMPFGPFLLAGSIIAFGYGESLISIYVSILN